MYPQGNKNIEDHFVYPVHPTNPQTQATATSYISELEPEDKLYGVNT